MLIDEGVFALEKILKEAEPYPVDGVFTVKSEEDYMIDVFNNGKKKGTRGINNTSASAPNI